MWTPSLMLGFLGLDIRAELVQDYMVRDLLSLKT